MVEEDDPLMTGRGVDKSDSWSSDAFVTRGSREHLESILETRRDRYGAFAANADVAQKIKGCIRLAETTCGLSFDQAEALDLIASKISRIVTGDPDYVDNWDDIAGYAKLVADRLRGDTG